MPFPRLSGCLTLAALLASSGSAQATPFFAATGHLGTYGGTRPEAISADGSVVVGSSAQSPFRWTAATGIEALGRLDESGGFATATGVTSDGFMIVGYDDPTLSAWTWTAATGVLRLDLGTTERTRAWDISDDGSTIVGSRASEGFRLEGADLDTRAQEFPYAVSADGGVTTGVSSYLVGRVFRWQGESVTFANQLVAANLFPANEVDITPDGSIVVGGTHGPAFTWSAMAGVTLLPTLEDEEAKAWGVSADGSVIVGAVTTAEHAVPYDPVVWLDGEIFRLKELMLREPMLYDDLRGWESIGPARAVSDDGRTITGTGLRDGMIEGWVLHLDRPLRSYIPEPATALLFGVGLVGIAAGSSGSLRRRRAGSISIRGRARTKLRDAP